MSRQHTIYITQSRPEAVQLTLTQPKINESHLALKLHLVVLFSNGCNQDLQKMPKYPLSFY